MSNAGQSASPERERPPSPLGRLARICAALVVAGAAATGVYAVVAWLAGARFGEPEHLGSVLALQFFLWPPAYAVVKRVGFLATRLR